jgi:hypothetical protein
MRRRRRRRREEKRGKESQKSLACTQKTIGRHTHTQREKDRHTDRKKEKGNFIRYAFNS